MAVCTFTNFETYGVPEGHQVLEWLDKVNKLDNDKYRIQGTEIYYGLFWRKSKMIYELICNYSGQKVYKYSGQIEVQVIGLSSCCDSSTLNEIMSFLIGFVNGYKVGNEADVVLNVEGKISYD